MTERLFCIEIQNKYLFSFLAYVHGSVNHKSDFFILRMAPSLIQKKFLVLSNREGSDKLEGKD